MNPRFDHEKLNVYQSSLKFVAWATELIYGLQAKAAVKDQLDREPYRARWRGTG